MIGQAILKSVAFTSNSMALRFLKSRETHTTISQTWTSLLLAAMFAGFVTSFLTVPFERIKVMMQAQKKSQVNSKKLDKNEMYYHNEWDCLRAILRQEGFTGLMLRGLGTTLAREVPSFMIYFVVYALFIQREVVKGPLAPLVGGAFAGCACWIPVYPVDVVKTIVQNTDGGSGTKTSYQIAAELYRTGGIGAFFDGLTPKMLRAAINHAVTFFLYDNIVAAATK
jgi:Mitochondrial carrier protein